MTNEPKFNRWQSLSAQSLVDAARSIFSFGLLGAAVSGVICAAIGFACFRQVGAIDGLLLGALAGFEITALGVAIGGKPGAFVSGAIVGYLAGAFGIAMYDVGDSYTINQTVEWALQHPVAFLFGVCGALIASFIAERLAQVLRRYRLWKTVVDSLGESPLHRVSLPIRLAIAVAEMAPIAATIPCVLQHMQVM